MAEDDALTALVVEKGQALAQCNVARLQRERTDYVCASRAECMENEAVYCVLQCNVRRLRQRMHEAVF